MEILTGEQMRSVDRRTIDRIGIPGATLMDNAGRGVAHALLEDVADLDRRSLLVLCGKGNNGGDGLVVARCLLGRGLRARVILLARGDELRREAEWSLRAAREAGVDVQEVADSASWERAREALARATFVIDALLGTGVHGGAHGLVARVIDDVVRAGVPVASIDLPSGVDADRGELSGPTIRAERTYTLCRPKAALVLEPAATYAGSWRVISIGIPDEAVAEERSTLEWLDESAAASLLPERRPDSHKGTYGHLLAVAGSRGKSGAAVLVARGALRAGVGLVTVAAPRSVQGTIAVQQAELMTEPLPETRSGDLGRGSARRVLRHLADRDALAIGPGLGVARETREAIVAAVLGRTGAAVVDADGLSAFAATPGAGRRLRAVRLPLVLTPHPGEAARLLGTTPAEVQADRPGAALALARDSGGVAVLKGHRTVIAHPDGRLAFNASGNPGMASGGVGDVLTGVIGAFLARGLDAWDAARLGVFVHGSAGDRAAARRGQDGTIATDVVEALPGALAGLARRKGLR